MIFFIKQSDFYSSISNRFIPVVYTIRVHFVQK